MKYLSRKKLFAFFPLVLFAGVGVLFVIRLFSGDPSKVPSPLVFKAAPSFQLEPLGTFEAFSEQDLKNGKTSILNVWASWCAPCRQEHPFLMQLSKETDIQVFGLNYKDKTDQALRFLSNLGNPYYKIGADPKGQSAIEWGVYGVPETFIVNGQGIIIYKHIGPITEESFKTIVNLIKNKSKM